MDNRQINSKRRFTFDGTMRARPNLKMGAAQEITENVNVAPQRHSVKMVGT